MILLQIPLCLMSLSIIMTTLDAIGKNVKEVIAATKEELEGQIVWNVNARKTWVLAWAKCTLTIMSF